MINFFVDKNLQLYYSGANSGNYIFRGRCKYSGAEIRKISEEVRHGQEREVL